ncbi:MAG: hypothetical protein Kow0062_08880 [Acidobacteriota bacterium]
MSRSFRYAVAFVLLALAAAAAGAAPADQAAPASDQRARKVVILGFDGADPNLVDRFMADGLLPNLARLSREASYARIVPPNPPQTPVSWSSFSTGLLPGRTEIFDFLMRRPHTYIPDFALAERQRRVFGFGEWNGAVAGGALGLLAGLLALVLGRAVLRRWTRATIAGLVVALACGAALTPVFSNLLPVEVPAAKNNRKGKPFWTVAAEHGMRVGVVRMPVTFPAEELPEGSRMISGLGVPDMRGRVGTPSLWTSDPRFSAGNNQFSLEIRKLPARRGRVETEIIGPFDYPFHVYVVDRAEARWREQGLSAAEIAERREELKRHLEERGHPEQIRLPLMLEITDEALTLEASGRSATLRPGEWTDFVPLDFPINWLVDALQPLRGMVRFKLISLEPEVQLYMSPINFHPSSHPIFYTWPPDLAEEVAERTGLFKTQGWAIDTWSYPSNRVGGIELFLEDMDFTVSGFERVMNHMLEQDFDLYIQVFYFPDRAGHLLWHNLDPEHPLYEPENAERFDAAMRAVYQRMDTIVGEALAKIDDDTLFMVVSDHGFSTFRRQINYNTWLYQNGFLALKGKTRTRNLEQLFDRDVRNVDVFSGIDWSRTKAWAMGLGSIYINLVGREPQGVVMPGEEYEEVVRQIREGLEQAVDPETGLHPVYRVYTRDEIAGQYDAEKFPDLRASNIITYRVSWQDTLGGLSTAVFEDNDRTWSADHCSLEPTLIPGILFVNRRLDVERPRMIDVAPSILAELGLDPPGELDGRPVWKPGAR